MAFKEEDHPRDDDGKFTDGNGEVSSLPSARKVAATIPQKAWGKQTEAYGSRAELDELLGDEFKGYTGQDAVNKLLKERRGHVKGAFHRDDIGDIDLLCGDNSLGIQHIIMQRDAQGIDGENYVKEISDTIEKGVFVKVNDKGNYEYWYNGKMAVIAPEYHGNKITYLLTAYKTRKKAPSI